MLQSLVASTRKHPVPPPADFLTYATTGGASLLGRRDIGRLAPGMAADLFAIDTRRMDYVGTRHDPLSLLAKVGIGTATDMTMINVVLSGQMENFRALTRRSLQRTRKRPLPKSNSKTSEQ